MPQPEAPVMATHSPFLLPGKMTEHAFLPGQGKRIDWISTALACCIPVVVLLPGRRLCLRCVLLPVRRLIEEIENILCIGKTSHRPECTFRSKELEREGSIHGIDRRRSQGGVAFVHVVDPQHQKYQGTQQFKALCCCPPGRWYTMSCDRFFLIMVILFPKLRHTPACRETSSPAPFPATCPTAGSS